MLLRICTDHPGVVPGGSGTYENGTGEVLDQPEWFPDNRYASRQLTRLSDFLDCNSDGPGTYPDSSGTSKTVPEGLRSVPEGLGMS